MSFLPRLKKEKKKAFPRRLHNGFLKITSHVNVFSTFKKRGFAAVMKKSSD